MGSFWGCGIIDSIKIHQQKTYKKHTGGCTVDSRGGSVDGEGAQWVIASALRVLKQATIMSTILTKSTASLSQNRTSAESLVIR